MNHTHITLQAHTISFNPQANQQKKKASRHEKFLELINNLFIHRVVKSQSDIDRG